VRVWDEIPHEIVGRIIRECDRLYRDTRRRASTVILGRGEWHELELWYKASYRYFGTGADLFEEHASRVLGAVPVVDPLSENRITPVFEPRLTAFMSPELFRS